MQTLPTTAESEIYTIGLVKVKRGWAVVRLKTVGNRVINALLLSDAEPLPMATLRIQAKLIDNILLEIYNDD